MTSVDSDRVQSNGGVRPAGVPPERSGSQEPGWALELRTTASALVIPTIRALAADLAVRADFDLDSVDDLRMAVDDLCVILTRIAGTDAALSCMFTMWPDRIEVTAEVDISSVANPLPTGSFSWRMLECLADEVSAVSLPSESGRGPRVRITLMKDAIREQP